LAGSRENSLSHQLRVNQFARLFEFSFLREIHGTPHVHSFPAYQFSIPVHDRSSGLLALSEVVNRGAIGLNSTPFHQHSAFDQPMLSNSRSPRQVPRLDRRVLKNQFVQNRQDRL
jgi:hypothetical protein